MTLPKSILDRIDRVREYHATTRLVDSTAASAPDPTGEPLRYQIFNDLPKVALPTNIIGAPVSSLMLLAQGVDAVPDTLRQTTQTLNTLASWLFLADGNTVQRPPTPPGTMPIWERTCFSDQYTFPFELYVASLGLIDLPAGLYHYSPREFALRQLRDGPSVLAQIKKARLDIDLVKTAPAALIVSLNCARPAWLFGKRAYRSALMDGGHLVQNIVTAGAGLGIPTQVNLRIHDALMRELIGIGPDANFGDIELVQAIIFWAEKSPLRGGESGDTGVFSSAAARPDGLTPIARRPPASRIIPYGSILATHADCVGPGVSSRDLRAPLTERSPVSADHAIMLADGDEPLIGATLSKVLLQTKQAEDFARSSISRPRFVQLNRLAFRGGSYPPIVASGPHVGLIRPIWIINEVAGVASGAWVYQPIEDRWICLREDEYRMECRYLAADCEAFGNAAAVCVLTAELATLMSNAGPDAYRLAHLEAGVVAQRLLLAAGGMGLGAIPRGSFYDAQTGRFLALEGTGWEPLYFVAVGQAAVADRPMEEAGTSRQNDQPS